MVPSLPGPSARGKRGQTHQRARARGGLRGRLSNQDPGTSSPNRGRGRGRDFDSPRGRKRHIEGIGGSQRGPIRPKTTLSELLFKERPLLRPIKFVPSVHTKVLFQDEEDLLQPLVEDVGELILKNANLLLF